MRRALPLVLFVAQTIAAAAGTADLARATFDDLWRRVTDSPPPAGVTFAVGADAGLRPGKDDFALVSAPDGKGLEIRAATERALLYGVYRFFELKADCAWFWDGDRIPKKPGLDLAGLDVVERARFDWRGIRYFAHRGLHRFQAEMWDLDDWKREIDWCVKKRLNFFMLRIGQDDLFHRAFPDVVPEQRGYKIAEKGRGYDNRELFWPMSVRSEIRREALAYARSRGIAHPADTGTMSHWYSRTPDTFVEKFKPPFLPQASGNYTATGTLVWDIRRDEWLDRYFKLTEAEIAAYLGGKPELFHTIGLAERRNYADRAKNHELKLYAYRRIIERLRKSYPTTPLLVGSWDFVYSWKPAEVRALVKTLDPSNTILFDYTSDTPHTGNSFLDWGVVGKFPYTFGIFNSYAGSNEMRGNYALIETRFKTAAADPMCVGIDYWPENAHSDTLMSEFFAEIAARPENASLEKFLPEFCRRRYGRGETAGKMLALWRRIVPVLDAVGWNIGTYGMFYDCPESVAKIRPHMDALAALIADCDRAYATAGDPFVRRDLTDIERCAIHRRQFADRSLDRQKLVDVLSRSAEFSIEATLAGLAKAHPLNPDFRPVLYENVSNRYCRCQALELAKEAATAKPKRACADRPCGQ